MSKKEQWRVGLPCNHQMKDSLLQEASDDKSPLGIDKAVEICKCLRGWIRSDRRSVDPHTYAITGSYMYNRWVITVILELTFHLLLKIVKYFISVVHFPWRRIIDSGWIIFRLLYQESIFGLCRVWCRKELKFVVTVATSGRVNFFPAV